MDVVGTMDVDVAAQAEGPDSVEASPKTTTKQSAAPIRGGKAKVPKKE
jgi:hypothetical protein